MAEQGDAGRFFSGPVKKGKIFRSLALIHSAGGTAVGLVCALVLARERFLGLGRRTLGFLDLCPDIALVNDNWDVPDVLDNEADSSPSPLFFE